MDAKVRETLEAILLKGTGLQHIPNDLNEEQISYFYGIMEQLYVSVKTRLSGESSYVLIDVTSKLRGAITAVLNEANEFRDITEDESASDPSEVSEETRKALRYLMNINVRQFPIEFVVPSSSATGVAELRRVLNDFDITFITGNKTDVYRIGNVTVDKLMRIRNFVQHGIYHAVIKTDLRTKLQNRTTAYMDNLLVRHRVKMQFITEFIDERLMNASGESYVCEITEDSILEHLVQSTNINCETDRELVSKLIHHRYQKENVTVHHDVGAKVFRFRWD
jgi:hypothetical protein